MFNIFAGATILKSVNEYFRVEEKNYIANFSNFAVDTIVILPAVVNIWHIDNKPLCYGAYLGVVLGFMPQYMVRTSSDVAQYITHQYESYSSYNNTATDGNFDCNLSYAYTTFRGVIPAFTRGMTYYVLKYTMRNEPFSALIGSSIMSLMLDQSETYTAMSINIAISGLNAAANKIHYFKFYTPLDKIYPQSSTIIAIEFVEYFLRAVEIESVINTIYDEYGHNHQEIINLFQIQDLNNDIIYDEL